MICGFKPPPLVPGGGCGIATFISLLLFTHGGDIESMYVDMCIGILYVYIMIIMSRFFVDQKNEKYYS